MKYRLILFASIALSLGATHITKVHHDLTFGDHITFQTGVKPESGHIIAITFDKEGTVDYTVTLDDSPGQGVSGVYPKHIKQSKSLPKIKIAEEDITNTLDNLSADTWSEGDYIIYFTNTKCRNNLCTMYIEAVEEMREITEKSTACKKFYLNRVLPYYCIMPLKANDMAYSNSGRLVISEGWIERLDQCVMGRAYNHYEWKIEALLREDVVYDNTCKE